MNKNITRTGVNLSDFLQQLETAAGAPAHTSLAFREDLLQMTTALGIDPGDLIMAVEAMDSAPGTSAHYRAVWLVMSRGELYTLDAFLAQAAQNNSYQRLPTTYEDAIANRPKNIDDWGKRLGLKDAEGSADQNSTTPKGLTESARQLASKLR